MSGLNVMSYADLGRDVLRLVPFCVERGISAVYGVPRSGLLPATMLASALSLPLGVPGLEPRQEMGGNRLVRRMRVAQGPALLIDDSVNHGAALKASSAAMKREHLRAAVYIRPDSTDLVDVHARVLTGPRFFQWNLFNCDAGKRFMFDFDGVLCVDPKPFDDDGPEYQQALRRAVPRYVPTWPIGWIATNRIERWRATTMEWLARHGVEVEGGVYMQPFATAAERRAASTPAEFKARCYMNERTAVLFVESDERQAEQIHAITGRPVLAAGTMKVFQ